MRVFVHLYWFKNFLNTRYELEDLVDNLAYMGFFTILITSIIEILYIQ